MLRTFVCAPKRAITDCFGGLEMTLYQMYTNVLHYRCTDIPASFVLILVTWSNVCITHKKWII